MNLVKTLHVNSGRLFIVGDLHGELPTLLEMLRNIEFIYGEDTLVCVGDLIDRGDHNLDTVKFFAEDKTGSLHSVRGNHDHFAAKHKEPWQMDNWMRNGGGWVARLSDSELDMLQKASKALPYAMEVTYHGMVVGIVHAEVPYRFKDWGSFKEGLQDPSVQREAIWGRSVVRLEEGMPESLLGVNYVVHGHSVLEEASSLGNRVYIDTGCTFDRHLTLLEIHPEGGTTIYTLPKVTP
jgi:serine/threonine protein phosphatase 1